MRSKTKAGVLWFIAARRAETIRFFGWGGLGGRKNNQMQHQVGQASPAGGVLWAHTVQKHILVHRQETALHQNFAVQLGRQLGSVAESSVGTETPHACVGHVRR